MSHIDFATKTGIKSVSVSCRYGVIVLSRMTVACLLSVENLPGKV